MSKLRYPTRNIRWILAFIVVVTGLALVKPTPVYALSIGDYFSYSYSIQLSQTEVYRGEAFSATVSGEATCKKNLPFGANPNAASVTSRITAYHDTTGDVVVLNSGYTVTLDSFPGDPGDSVQDSVVVPLTFPQNSQPGTYTIIGEIVTAKVRVAFIWLDVTRYLPTSQVLGSITCFTRYISETGEFLMRYTAKSADSRAAVTLQAGTIGLTQQGNPLDEITVNENPDSPPPPADSEAVGLAYDFGPEGASFDQPVTIRLGYEDALLPENVAEKKLCIATWDTQLEEWVLLDSTVDITNNIITTEVTHFSLYTILAYTRPASFNTSDLSISPQEAASGEKVVISTVVTNTGDLTGIYQLVLKINGEVYYVRSARLDGGDSATESFPVYWDTPGTHTVEIAGLTGTFTIEPDETVSTPSTDDDTTPVIPTTFTVDVTPVEIAGGVSVAICVLVTNTSDRQNECRVSLMKDNIRVDTKEIRLSADGSQQVVFTTLQDDAASYTVETTGLGGAFTVEDTPPSVPETPAPEPTATLNWWLVGGIIACCVIGGLMAFVMLMRRRALTGNA